MRTVNILSSKTTPTPLRQFIESSPYEHPANAPQSRGNAPSASLQLSTASTAREALEAMQAVAAREAVEAMQAVAAMKAV
jgi:hypothetical protein